MSDNLTPEQRRKTMSRVKSRDTGPEMKVRRLAHSLGFRFRLHREDLPGKPDLVFPRLNKLIFVHGCFWHGHDGCEASARPASNTDYWNKKLDRNKKRDQVNIEKLIAAGWDVLVIWECQTKDQDELRLKISDFLRK
jgi:DNA mismatch endonuclease (patch repair protein)